MSIYNSYIVLSIIFWLCALSLTYVQGGTEDVQLSAASTIGLSEAERPPSGPTEFHLPSAGDLNKYPRVVLPTSYAPATFRKMPAQFQRVEIPNVQSQTTTKTRETIIQPRHTKTNPTIVAAPLHGKSHQQPTQQN